MRRSAVVIRPEPGNARTAERLEAAGVTVVRLPFFGVVPIEWTRPDPDRFDSLLLTSANAIRNAGAGLEALRGFPIIAVGEATAAACLAAGLKVAIVGRGDVESATLLASDAGYTRWLHLAGRHASCGSRARATVSVYASEPLAISRREMARLEGGIVLLHSTRAARRLRRLAAHHRLKRAATVLVPISAQVADAAGGGWSRIVTAPAPTDAAMVEAARMLAIDPRGGGDDKEQ